jgi:hypothetical protein
VRRQGLDDRVAAGPPPQPGFCPPPPKGIFQVYSPAASRTGS